MSWKDIFKTKYDTSKDGRRPARRKNPIRVAGGMPTIDEHEQLRHPEPDMDSHNNRLNNELAELTRDELLQLVNGLSTQEIIDMLVRSKGEIKLP